MAPSLTAWIDIGNSVQRDLSGIFWGYQVYYCVQTRSHAQWGQQGALLNTLVEASWIVQF